MGQIIVAGIGAGAVYGLFALGLVLVYRATRVLNFAQSEIGTFATYVAWALVVEVHVPWAVAALAAVACAAILGLLFERTVVRPLLEAPRLAVVVGTVAVTFFLGGLELKVWGASPRILPSPFTNAGVSIADVILTPPRLLALAVTAAFGLAFAVFFKRTNFGLALLASAQDPIAVRLTGIRLRHLSAFTWAVSSAIGAVAGIVIALSLGAFAEFFMARIMLMGFAAAVLGGMTSLPGALVGGLAIGIAEAATSRYLIGVPGVVEALMFGVIVAVLLVRPRGMLGRAA